MQVRFGGEDLALLRRAGKEWGEGWSYSDIAQRAVRRARRLGIDLAAVEPSSTYQGEALRITGIPADCDPDTVRRAVSWALRQYDWTDAKKPQPFKTAAREGVDYIVEE